MRPKQTRTYEQLGYDMDRMTRNGKVDLFMHSGWGRERYGSDFAQMYKRQLQEKGYTLKSEYQAPWRDPDTNRIEKQGMCRIYSAPLVHQVPTTPTAIENHTRYERTNLAELRVPFTYAEGRDGDERVYHAGTKASGALWNVLTIDNEPTVEVDLSCAFPALVGQALGAEQEILTLAGNGTLYDILAEITDMPRNAAKLAVSKIMNSPKRASFGTMVTGVNYLGQSITQYVPPEYGTLEYQAQKVVTAFKVAFPKTNIMFRQYAKEIDSWVAEWRTN